jgi:hypothetical protein
VLLLLLELVWMGPLSLWGLLLYLLLLLLLETLPLWAPLILLLVLLKLMLSSQVLWSTPTAAACLVGHHLPGLHVK